jgi:tetratricopeptide (TPR) repeat protein
VIANWVDTQCDVPASDLVRFAAGEAPRPERRKILEHLLGGCGRCRETLSALRQLGEGTDPVTEEEASGPSLARILTSLGDRAARIEKERTEVAQLLPDFLAHPVARQWTLLRNSRRYDTWSFAAALIDEAFRTVMDEARKSRELADMALTISARLDKGLYGERSISDLTGRALSHLANAQRTLGDLSAAEETLARARAAWESGTGDPLDEAELLYFEASMLRGRRRFDDALRRARRSARLYRELGDQHLEARSRMNEAHILSISGNPQGARELMQRILPLFDPDRDPKLAFVARHNLVWYTMECGLGDDALRILAEFRDGYAGAGQRSTYARLHWLEGRISEQLGRDEEVESAYGRAIADFAELELPYELATVSLDLAAFFARKSRVSEVRQIAERTMVLFRGIGVAEPLIAAWMIFRRAAEAEAVTVGLIERLVRYHSEARYRPELEFQG